MARISAPTWGLMLALLGVYAPARAQDLRHEIDTLADAERWIASSLGMHVCGSDSGRWTPETRIFAISVPRVVRARGLGRRGNRSEGVFSIEIAKWLPPGTPSPLIGADNALMTLKPLGPVELHYVYTATRGEVERLARARTMFVVLPGETIWCPLDSADHVTLRSLLQQAWMAER